MRLILNQQQKIGDWFAIRHLPTCGICCWLKCYKSQERVCVDHIELKCSDNIKSRDELRSEKQGGTVGVDRNVLRSNIQQTPKL
jgi:hypothetical protein